MTASTPSFSGTGKRSGSGTDVYRMSQQDNTSQPETRSSFSSNVPQSNPSNSYSYNPFLEPVPPPKPQNPKPLQTTPPFIKSSSNSSIRTKTNIFGASLKVGICNPEGQQIYSVPPIISDTIEQLMNRGLKEEGIFRIGGSHATMNKYRERYDRGERVDLSAEKDINNVSGLLKMYLRELPEHIFTDNLLPVFDNALLDPAETDNIFTQLLPLLPEVNLLILKDLFKLLDAIAKNSKINMMNSHNLGIIFTQVLKISGVFFAYLMSHTFILENAQSIPTTSSSSQDLISFA